MQTIEVRPFCDAVPGADFERDGSPVRADKRQCQQDIAGTRFDSRALMDDLLLALGRLP